MSSSTFSAAINPERRLRRVVLFAAIVLAFLGAGLIMDFPIASSSRLILVSGWLVYSLAEAMRIATAYGNTLSYRIDADGSMDVLKADGGRQMAELAAGSFVLPRVAWLRVRTDSGAVWGELLVGNARENQQWRRFQVICRHRRAC